MPNAAGSPPEPSSICKSRYERGVASLVQGGGWCMAFTRRASMTILIQSGDFFFTKKIPIFSFTLVRKVTKPWLAKVTTSLLNALRERLKAGSQYGLILHGPSCATCEDDFSIMVDALRTMDAACCGKTDSRLLGWSVECNTFTLLNS